MAGRPGSWRTACRRIPFRRCSQTKDGFLWLGTEAGLVRFDGVAFQIYDRTSNPALPGNDIRCLIESRDGALWIGTNAGLARWKDGAVTVFTTRDGLPGNGVLTLHQGEDGKLYVWTEQGPAQQAGDRFLPGTSVDAFPRTALPLPGESPGAAVFKEKMPDGTVVSGGRSALDLVPPRKLPGVSFHLAAGKELPGSRIQTVFADREGALWIGTNAGLARWVRQGRALSRHRCAGHGVDSGAHGRPRGQSVGGN